MGLIREPKNVDFSVQSKPWTAKELSDFRKLMTKLKVKKAPANNASANRKLRSTNSRKLLHNIFLE